jgi:hypothetical protein
MEDNRELLNKLIGMKVNHFKISLDMLKAYNGSAYQMDLLSAAVLKRSLSNINGFANAIYNNNFILSASIIRLQLDTYVRYFSAWQVGNPNDFISYIMSGEQINRFKDRTGQSMTDKYLCQLAAKENPWIIKVYEETCGYIHLSSKHLFNTIQADIKEIGTINLAISDEDQFISDFDKQEAILAMINITELIFSLVNGWVFTKDNPDIVKKLKDQRKV